MSTRVVTTKLGYMAPHGRTVDELRVGRALECIAWRALLCMAADATESRATCPRATRLCVHPRGQRGVQQCHPLDGASLEDGPRSLGTTWAHQCAMRKPRGAAAESRGFSGPRLVPGTSLGGRPLRPLYTRREKQEPGRNMLWLSTLATQDVPGVGEATRPATPRPATSMLSNGSSEAAPAYSHGGLLANQELVESGPFRFLGPLLSTPRPPPARLALEHRSLPKDEPRACCCLHVLTALR